MRANRLLGAGLFTLAALIVGYAVLGPLILDVIHFRTSASGLNQVRGGDLAALVVVAPVCVAVGVLAWRDHRAAPVLALAPAFFAMYTYSQLILGNEYLRLPGNIERSSLCFCPCSSWRRRSPCAAGRLPGQKSCPLRRRG
jgi:hypothetical protein